MTLRSARAMRVDSRPGWNASPQGEFGREVDTLGFTLGEG